ncbi:MAG: hypothetical protein R6U22_04140 [Desulfohalobiaceae bacterium]
MQDVYSGPGLQGCLQIGFHGFRAAVFQGLHLWVCGLRGFKSFAQARLLASFSVPRLPRACGGVRVRSKAGLWWVSVPVAEDSVPEEVARGGAVCSLGSPPDVRAAIKGHGWV